MKRSDIRFVLSKLNSFRENSSFTFDSVPNNDVKFLYLKLTT